MLSHEHEEGISVDHFDQDWRETCILCVVCKAEHWNRVFDRCVLVGHLAWELRENQRWASQVRWRDHPGRTRSLTFQGVEAVAPDVEPQFTLLTSTIITLTVTATANT